MNSEQVSFGFWNFEHTKNIFQFNVVSKQFLMLNSYEMSSVCVDRGAMWRLSEDFNRRFAARVHQSHHVHSYYHHRPSTMAMIYNGKATFLLWQKNFNPKSMAFGAIQILPTA